MANNRIGCSSGKTKLIDPNNFYGQSSSNNMSVPLEDLTISVQLTTNKKGRTVLSSNNSINTAQSSNTVRVTFIEGTEVNGQKVLTSKFTDLTTVFDKDTPNGSSENLGITNIDIDFNSSYAPMVTINFIDLRGSSIFQNESQLNNSENKYSVFFQLPYPLYELTIKGYYGKPVKYCLHMTKFNSKFNSQTGNFEITASFIGYTYAMLSDMLLGILKAIPYTSKGKDKYKVLKEADTTVLNLNELMIKIGQIDLNLEKIGASDPNAAKLKKTEEMLDKLIVIKNKINQLGQVIDYKTDLTGEEAYKYIVINNSSTAVTTQVGKEKTSYNTQITELIAAYNLLESDVKAGAGLTYSYFLTDNATKTLTQNIQVFYNENFSNQTAVITDVYDRKNLVAITKPVNIYNMSPLFSEIDIVRVRLELHLKDLKKTLGETIKESITKSLTFQPTIRNIVNVFTNAVEIFLAIIYDVSKEAENHPERDAQLKLAFTENGNSDLKQRVKFYPWPDYRDNDAKNGYVEKYLGSPGVLRNPKVVDELLFINDLYNAFLTAKQVSDEALLQQQLGGSTWMPTNPFDTKIYNNKSPYDRLISTTTNDIISLMLIRMMTFMGYTHHESLIDSDVIKTIAEAEANAFLRSKNLNDLGKTGVVAAFTTALQNNNFDSIVKTKNTINGIQPNVIEESVNESGYYTYTYIGRDNIPDTTTQFRFLPISDSFSGVWPTNLTDLELKRKSNSKFLSNYTRSTSTSSVGGKKLDGAWYVDIIELTKYETINGKGLIDAIAGTPPTDIIKLSDLKVNKGYSLFSGPYGMQEFKNMDYGTVLLPNAPIKYLFYKEKMDNIPYNATTNDGKTKLLTNFISYGRKPSYTNQPHDITNPNSTSTLTLAVSPVANIPGVPQVTTPLTIQPITFTGPKLIQVPDKWFDTSNSGARIKYPRSLKMVQNGYYATPLHSNENGEYIENNRYMLNLYNNSATQNSLSYPYIEMQLWDGNNSSYTPFSLFGSKLYYNQKGDKNGRDGKAFLFLNTLPFEFPFETDEIINLFNKTGGFIHAPRLWCAWVGGLIWRAGLNTGNLNNNSTIAWKDPIDIPTYWDGKKYVPMYQETASKQRFSYLTDIRRTDNANNPDLQSFSNLFLYLPQQILDEFYSEFYRFITDGTWDNLRYELELVNETNSRVNSKGEFLIGETFNDIIDGIYSEAYLNATKESYKGKINVNLLLKFNNIKLLNGEIISERYEIVIPAYEFASKTDGDHHNDALFLELKGNYGTNYAIQLLLDALNEEVVIANSGYGVWINDAKKLGTDSITNENHQNILVKSSFVTEYLKNMAQIIKTYDENKDKESRQNKQDVFGTENDEIIKLQLYRTCKNVYDKWVGNAINGDNVIFQCGGDVATRHTTDKDMAAKRGADIPKLIDSFRFVTRSFRDIGDDFFVDPRPIGTYLTDNPNSSFYDCITNLLAANNFDFIALPSFINYNDKETVESVFDTYTYQEGIKKGICGPSFVCVYIGQKSKHLDFNGSEYDNDGFDIQCLPGGAMKNGLPKDFNTDSKAYENDVAVFKVAYSQQNQNIFKDIILDQSEFTETEESLKIIDDISKTGSENQRHFGGQNLYSVYGVRSYKTEVEMMGNAMIQPMMYFQLDNIPMFHGAYLITHVKHSIKPNYMSTNFTGVRVRSPETPILDAAELYMSLIENINITAINTSSAGLATIAQLVPTINASAFSAEVNKKYTSY